MADRDNKELSKSRSGARRTAHRLTSLKLRLLWWEITAQCKAPAAALIEELRPTGVMEAILVDRIVWAWRLRRAARVEQLEQAKLPKLSAKYL